MNILRKERKNTKVKGFSSDLNLFYRISLDQEAIITL